MTALLTKVHPAKVGALIAALVMGLPHLLDQVFGVELPPELILNESQVESYATALVAWLLGQVGAKTTKAPTRHEKKAARQDRKLAKTQANQDVEHERLKAAMHDALDERAAELSHRDDHGQVADGPQDGFDAFASSLPSHSPSPEDVAPIPRSWAPSEPGDTSAGPVGFRANNPGCIIRKPGPQGAWKGLASPAEDGFFCRFIHPKWGARALIRVARNYARRGLKTFRQARHEWAPLPPPGMEEFPLYKGNDPDADAEFIAAQLGLEPDDIIPLSTHEQRAAYAKAVGLREVGRQVLEWPEDIWLEGSKLEAA